MNPYYQDDSCTIYHGDCLEVLPQVTGDVVLADPPYNVGKDYGSHNDSMPDSEYRSWLSDVLLECGRASRDGVVFFPGTKNFPWAREVLDGTSLSIHRVLGWHRKEFAGDKWNGGPAMAWEPIVWASSELKPFYNKVFGTWGRDFLVVPSTHGDPYAKLHPCPKPLSVMKWLVGLFCPEGGTVIDPFMGTGPTLLAAKDSQRQAIGIEVEEKYCEIAAKRLSQEVLELA